ncbi:MAG: hypothetical protein JJU40_01385 [Rhodobacteraceae bacterium]|nr:hypothetical protein [Paracoccaceae bacterium]
MRGRHPLACAALALALALAPGGPAGAGLAVVGGGAGVAAEAEGRLGHGLIEIEAGEGYALFAAPPGMAHDEASLFVIALVRAIEGLDAPADPLVLYAALNAEFGRLAERMPRQRPALGIRSTEPLPVILPAPAGARALLIAQEYIAAGIPGLSGAAEDLALLADALSGRGWAVEEHLNPSGRVMLEAVAALAAGLGPGETGLVYLGGQGMALPNGDRALAGADFRLLAPATPHQTGPEMMALEEMRALPLAPGAQVVVLIDAIFAEPRFLEAPREGESRR